MRCGKCKDDHDTVAEVRQCYDVDSGQPLTQGKDGRRGQYELIQILLAEREMTPLPPYDEAAKLYSKQQAGDMIRHLIDNVPKAESAKVDPKDIPDVPAGYYAIKSLTGNNDLDFFEVDRPVGGRWDGRTFVKRIIGGQNPIPIRGRLAIPVLQAITDAGPAEAGILFGQTLGQCYKCGRHLTDEVSRELGIGPTCRSL